MKQISDIQHISRIIEECNDIIFSVNQQCRNNFSIFKESREKKVIGMDMIIIGEECKKLIKDTKEICNKEHYNIFGKFLKWEEVIGLRNRYAHGYDSIDDVTI